MTMPTRELPIVAFKNQAELRNWLMDQHAASTGVWVRVFKKSSAIPSISSDQLLDEGLCFGWSESARCRYDDQSYLQKFTPRKTKGTASARNRKRIQELIDAGMMTGSGLEVL